MAKLDGSHRFAPQEPSATAPIPSPLQSAKPPVPAAAEQDRMQTADGSGTVIEENHGKTIGKP